MSAEQVFLKETVLSTKSTIEQRPGVVKVVQHVTGPLEDGCVVKEVSDGAVCMKAIFTKQSQDTFYESFEDSFSSQPDWQNAQLLLNQYSVQHQPSRHPANEEGATRFVLVVERFGLLNTHTGFFNKSCPTDIMADPAVQMKAAEMEGSQAMQHQSDSRHKTGGDSPETGAQSAGDTLNALLDELGRPSLSISVPIDQLENQTYNEPSNQQDDDLDPEPIPGNPQKDARKHQLLQKALKAKHILNVEIFLVSSDQQDLLDAIPEWKDGYVAPAEGNLPQYLTCRSSSSDSNNPQDFMAQGSTLRTEKDRHIPLVSTDTDKEMLTISEADERAVTVSKASEKAAVSETNKKTATDLETNKKAAASSETNKGATAVSNANEKAITVSNSKGGKPQTLEDEGKGANTKFHRPSALRIDGDSETVVTLSSDAAGQEKAGLCVGDLGPCSAPEQQEEVLGEEAGEGSESSGDAVSFFHHPDVSFTISSPSMGNESCSSGSLLSQSSGPKASGGGKPDVTDVTTVDSSRDLPLPATETVPATSHETGGKASRLTSGGDGLSPCDTAPRHGDVATDADAVSVSGETRTKVVQQVTEPSLQVQSVEQAKEESVMSATTDKTDQHPTTEGWRKKKSPNVPDFELPETMEFMVQQSLGFDPPADGNMWEQAQPGTNKHIMDWMQSQEFEPCRQKEGEQGETHDEMDKHSTGSQGFEPLDMELLDQASDLSGCEPGSEHLSTQSASRMGPDLCERSDKQRQTSATVIKHSTGTGRVMEREKEMKQRKTGREGEETRLGERRKQSRGMGREREDDVHREADTQRIRKEKDGEDTRQKEAEMKDIWKHTRSSSEVYQSTQSALSGNSQPPSLCLSLSPIKHHQPARRAHLSVLEMDEEENSQLLALEHDITESVSQATKDVSDTPEVLSEEGRDFDTATSLTAAALTDSSLHESPEAEGGGIVLVQASWSDSGEDSMDRMLLQQASRIDNVPSSNQTTVVPESSPEDVIVISSANDTSASEGASESSPSSGTSSDSNGDPSHGQPPLSETVIVISSSSGSSSGNASDTSDNSSQLEGRRECKLHPRPQNNPSTSVVLAVSRQPSLSKNSTTASVDLVTKSPGRSGQKDTDGPACQLHSVESGTSRSFSPAVSSDQEDSNSNHAGQKDGHALGQPSGTETENYGKRQQGKGVRHCSKKLSPAKKQQVQRHSKGGKELRVSSEKQQVEGNRKGGTDLRDARQKHHEQGVSHGGPEWRSPAKKQHVQGPSREGTEMTDSDEITELRDSEENCPKQKYSRRDKELRGFRDEQRKKGVSYTGRDVRNSAEKHHVQGHSKRDAGFRGSGQKQQMKGDRQTGRQSGTKETPHRQGLTNTAAQFKEHDSRKRTHKRAAHPLTETASEKRFKQTALVATTSQQHADNNSSQQTEGDSEMEGDSEEETEEGETEIGMEREKPREVERETVKHQGSGADSDCDDFQEMPARWRSRLGLIVRPRRSCEKRLRRLKLKEELMNKLEMAVEVTKVVQGATQKSFV